MKALQFKTFGNPHVLEYVDVPTPNAENDSVIVQVRSASVNPSDVKNVSGLFHHTVVPRVPGRDFSGVVVEGPPQWLGKSVWGTGGDIGFTRDGSHAQFLKLPLSALSAKPETLSHEEASAVGVNFVAAWLGIVIYARIAPGETVAVIGASGGVGGAVIQIAKARDCRVIGIDLHVPAAGSPAAILLDEYVPFNDDTAERVLELTGGADIVYDSVGGVAFETALKMTRWRSRVVEISATNKRRVDFDLVDFYRNETRLFGVDSAKLGVAESAPLMSELAAGFDDGKLRAPLIAHHFPLDQGQAAYRAVSSGSVGRVVINM